jgi:hypothetical protein
MDVPILQFDNVEVTYDELDPATVTRDDADDDHLIDDDVAVSGGCRQDVATNTTETGLEISMTPLDAGDATSDGAPPLELLDGDVTSLEVDRTQVPTSIPSLEPITDKYSYDVLSGDTVAVHPPPSVEPAAVTRVVEDNSPDWGSSMWHEPQTFTAEEVFTEQHATNMYTPGEEFEDVMVLAADVVETDDIAAFSTRTDQLWTIAGIQSLPQVERDAAMAAVRRELSSHTENHTWERVTKVPVGKKPIRTRGFLIRKPKRVDGKIVHVFKYRLVACGYSQDDTDFDVSESPVISMIALYTLLAVCASEQLDLFHCDFTTAFLMSSLERGINLYARLPPDLPGGLAGQLVKIRRAWYGLKQSSRRHYETTVQLLLDFGFEQSGNDPCVFNLILDGRTLQRTGQPVRRQWLEMWSNNTDVHGNRMHHKVRLGLYVDDIPFGITKGNPIKDKLLDHLRTVFKVTMEPLQFILNCEVDYQQSHRKLFLSQRMHTMKCVELILGSTSGVKKIATPMEPGYFPDMKGVDDDDSDFMSLKNRIERYRSMTCALLWLTRTRPDIAFSVTMLCKYLKSPRKCHWNDLKRIARYLAGTADRGLCFQPNSMQISAYSDSDWASDSSTRKSVSGYVVLLGDSVIYFKCQQQRIQALSSMEAETYALSGACQTVEFLRRLMDDFEFKQTSPTKIWVDNQATICMTKSILMSWRSRHIPIRDLRIRQLCQGWPADGIPPQVVIIWIDSQSNLADALTKSLGKELFNVHRDSMTHISPF